MAKILHPKIKELKLRSRPVNNFTIPESQLKELQTRQAKIKVGENQNAGYFCVWGVKDDRGTGWLKGTFNKSVRERGPGSAANQKIVACWMHDLKDPIGRPERIEEDDYGAYAVVTWDDPSAVPNAKRAKAQLDSGTLNGWSFGFDYVWDKMEYDEKTDTVWGREADLYEISPITFPSQKATFTIRSKAEYEVEKFKLDEETENLLRKLTREKQLLVRQILTKHISLAKIEPDTFDVIKSKTLKHIKPKSLMQILAEEL
jgi:hypothetical protein